jgi:phosphoglycerol transferase MdoB-like AlkP superfamily enzyme
MLGELRKHYSQDYLFRNAISATNGTFPTLEAILYNSPITPLTQGQSGYIPYMSSVVRPYKEAGYRTIFLTAGSAGWRSLSQTLKHQYFDEVYDMASIQEQFPDAHGETWGLYDEYMFDYGQWLLEERKDDRPVFLFMLSISNHPPYSLPDHYQAPDVDPSVLGKYGTRNLELARDIMGTYRYSNNALGQFISQVKAGGHADKTLIAATGDHNQREIFGYIPNEALHLQHGVPIYFYIPERYMNGELDTSMHVWHWDMFPTLFNLSLSGASYFNSGLNLAKSDDGESNCGATLLDKIVCSDLAAVTLNNPQYLEWNQGKAMFVPFEGNKGISAKAEHYNALFALSDWHIRQQAKGELPH